MEHFTPEDWIRYNTRNMVKTIYSMMFPYRNWNDDYLNACYQIKTEIRKWCTIVDKRLPLIMIGRVIGIKLNPDTSIKQICAYIQDHIINICLYDITGQTSALTISYKTNQPPRTDVNEICNIFIKN